MIPRPQTTHGILCTTHVPHWFFLFHNNINNKEPWNITFNSIGLCVFVHIKFAYMLWFNGRPLKKKKKKLEEQVNNCVDMDNIIVKCHESLAIKVGSANFKLLLTPRSLVIN